MKILFFCCMMSLCHHPRRPPTKPQPVESLCSRVPHYVKHMSTFLQLWKGWYACKIFWQAAHGRAFYAGIYYQGGKDQMPRSLGGMLLVLWLIIKAQTLYAWIIFPGFCSALSSREQINAKMSLRRQIVTRLDHNSGILCQFCVLRQNAKPHKTTVAMFHVT